ncbi:MULTISPECIES: antA/AntB antirepressor family protein [unclassified Paenibacillus]|uniref:antA/AntB antirepressor family protein n=1 Tax=unclassified Paenibacillus TaxID=185978 RepID=UPI00020D701C|nr:MULTISPECIES: antA/AntB antirepressor family protein [unclassified Paenibacillus]EGL20100.1 toxin-antitoxin system, toxin component, Bro family [Paenibacillus sp. HGF7]EPD81995.1 hypothetical protein HMPREF1207_03821 [Paenibacillus sp. HGH0039]
MSLESLELIEDEFVPVYRNEKGESVVDGRDLKEYLGVRRDYSTWLKGRVEEYSFELGKDFTPNRGKSTGGRPRVDHILSLDMAKELAMVENNQKEKEVRRYFIELESKYKAALQEIERLYSQLFDASNLITMNSAAKSIGIGRNKMFVDLRKRGIILKGSNVVKQQYIDRGLFVVKNVNKINKYKNKIIPTTFVTPKGLDYLAKLYIA